MVRNAGRRPIDKPRAFVGGRAEIWAVLREPGRHFAQAPTDGFYSTVSIARAAAAERRTVASFLASLHAAGIVERSVVGAHNTTYWRLSEADPRSALRHPPQVNAKGQEIVQGGGNDRLWRSMKMLGSFTTRELAAAASMPGATVRVATAGSYLKHLHRAGYVTVVPEGRSDRWTINRRRVTGPHAPAIQRSGAVFDRNEGRVVWSPEADEAAA
jgi:hypothetical protein